jgi:hypothetical protein
MFNMRQSLTQACNETLSYTKCPKHLPEMNTYLFSIPHLPVEDTEAQRGKAKNNTA